VFYHFARQDNIELPPPERAVQIQSVGNEALYARARSRKVLDKCRRNIDRGYCGRVALKEFTCEIAQPATNFKHAHPTNSGASQ
jgi:hypothetical protein